MFPFGSLYQHSDQLLSHLKIIFDFSQREIRGALGLPRLAWIRHAWCSTLFFSFSITVHGLTVFMNCCGILANLPLTKEVYFIVKEVGQIVVKWSEVHQGPETFMV